ncbi:non-ribosomal peptide synthetase [Endozoicomonas sp.]|uniref:non-ribosomal peptide synthetase n=1 Tax=Endozoicomonas sp. TaxID=1892382 RepID=UPI003D9B3163
MHPWDWFEWQVVKHPDRIAVISSLHKVTYRELLEQSISLAVCIQQRLTENSKTKHLAICICCQREYCVPVAILACLRAGVPWVPVDPDQPQSRIQAILLDSGCQVALTDQKNQQKFEDLNCECILLDTPDKNKKGGVQSTFSPSLFAYVIYTSGSTGIPKGVLIRNDCLCRLIAVNTMQLHEGDKVLQFASISFDLSIFEIFNTLLLGCTLVLATEKLRQAPQKLQTLLKREAVNVMAVTPSVLTLLKPELPSLNRLIIVAEKCSESLLNKWLPDRRIFNLYGPTETTMCATGTEYHPGLSPYNIGRPLPHIKTWVVDSDDKPVAPGLTGELYIGGRCLAEKYVNQPELTRERFKLLHTGQNSYEKVYCTGDLVKLLEDGSMEIQGRTDFQEKVLGHRIEPGEIEQQLLSHPAITLAVVKSVNEHHHKTLAAFYTLSALDNHPSPAPGDLLNFLRQQLPPYMIPSHFIAMENMPLTINGKVDRKALTLPSRKEIQLATETALTSIQEQLLTICSKILKDNTLTLQNDFFTSGGNSIRAAQLVMAMQQQFHCAVTLNRLYNLKSLAELAQWIEDQNEVTHEVI